MRFIDLCIKLSKWNCCFLISSHFSSHYFVIILLKSFFISNFILSQFLAVIYSIIQAAYCVWQNWRNWWNVKKLNNCANFCFLLYIEPDFFSLFINMIASFVFVLLYTNLVRCMLDLVFVAFRASLSGWKIIYTEFWKHYNANLLNK